MMFNSRGHSGQRFSHASASTDETGFRLYFSFSSMASSPVHQEIIYIAYYTIPKELSSRGRVPGGEGSQA